MRRIYFLTSVLVHLPWTALQLVTEKLALRTLGRHFNAGRHPFAMRPECINADWLGGLLRNHDRLLHNQRVEDIALQRFGEIGQMSAVYRIQPSYSEQDAGPRSLVLKTTAPEMKNRVFNSVLGVFARELLSYQLPQPTQGLLRPKLWYGAQHPVTKASILIIDDLGEWRGVPAYEKFTPEDVHKVVKALAVQHAQWWDKKAELKSMGFQTTPENDREALAPMCSLAWSKAQKVMAPLVDAETIALLGQYVAQQAAIGEYLVSGPCTLIHGDLNTNNLFFDDEHERVCAIDWQSTHIGHWAEDLAYLVQMGLSAENCIACEEALIEQHWRTLVEHGVEITQQAHRAGYALGLLRTGAILILATMVLDQEKDPDLYSRFKESITLFAAAAKRHQLVGRLQAIIR